VIDDNSDEHFTTALRTCVHRVHRRVVNLTMLQHEQKLHVNVHRVL